MRAIVSGPSRARIMTRRLLAGSSFISISLGIVLAVVHGSAEPFVVPDDDYGVFSMIDNEPSQLTLVHAVSCLLFVVMMMMTMMMVDPRVRTDAGNFLVI